MPSLVAIKDKIARYFATQPVEQAWVFGSVARGDATAASDLDILVQFTPNAPITLLKYGDMCNAIGKIARCDVDLVEYNQLKDFARDSAERDKILIYERKN